MMDKNKVWASVKSYQNGNKKRDFAGRIMDKSAYGDPNSEFCWNIDHILPVSCGGKDELENFIAVHCETNTEKANKFPHFKANNKSFEIRRSNKGFNKYEIVRIK
ncbi:HNH endonuclease domain-containing protein [Mycoplasmopsis cynos]|uniref:HNH endonuclease n=2 Tax=Mycoplasmopsis cynos TaxID=171284 RepID=UPI002AFFD36F|nr:HNH endonuclease domain-containing protein [Mycoplasmopsis cynos]WQQ18982.1 HNH endonuclease domain-containing protein [Mycoplasmopsis cynos]